MISIKKYVLPDENTALKGRSRVMQVSDIHYVTGNPIASSQLSAQADSTPIQAAIFGLGCFWGAEKVFWECNGVTSTAVGYAGGFTPNPEYGEVCSGHTGHNEVVLINYNSNELGYEELLKLFWESHNPTQGMAQGNDKGTQYRSSIFTFCEDQLLLAQESKINYQQRLDSAGFGVITTEIEPAPAFYYAEDAHQQYLAKNPGGYCGLGGTGIKVVE